MTGPETVHHAVPGEAILGQPGLEGGIAVEASTGVHQELGSPAHQKADMLRGPLEYVIENSENLLVVGLACL